MRSILVSIFNVFSTLWIEWKVFLWNNFRQKNYNIPIYKGFNFKMSGQGDITKWLYKLSHLAKYNKSFEGKTIEVFLSHLKEGDTFLDIGANVGMFSLVASRILKNKGVIHAFEPSQATYDTLNQNIINNKCDNVNIHRLALSDSEGTMTLSTPTNDYGTDAFAYLSGNKDVTETKNNQSQTVQVRTLDNFLTDNKISKVDVIKIDIEGAELLCFKGAEKLLSSAHQPIILFECLEELCSSRFNYSMMDLLKFLDAKNYHIEQFESWQWVAIPQKSEIS
jgi:FkbM family methyltransferase